MYFVLELKYKKPIDVILLTALQGAQGEYLAASQSIDIAESTFSRWLLELNLISDASRIRQSFGMPQTASTVRIVRETDSELPDTLKTTGDCTSCHRELISLPRPLEFTGVKKKQKVREFYAEVVDGEGNRHWFLLEVEELIPA